MSRCLEDVIVAIMSYIPDTETNLLVQLKKLGNAATLSADSKLWDRGKKLLAEELGQPDVGGDSFSVPWKQAVYEVWLGNDDPGENFKGNITFIAS